MDDFSILETRCLDAQLREFFICEFLGVYGCMGMEMQMVRFGSWVGFGGEEGEGLTKGGIGEYVS